MKNTYKTKDKSNKTNFDETNSEIDEQNKKFWAAVENILGGGY